MTTITLEDLQARHVELGKLIDSFKAALPAILHIPGTDIELGQGERYAGLILNDQGKPSHHLVLLPGDNDDATWQDQLEWAKSIGGDLPDRVEQALLFKHFKSEFQERAYWSNTPCEPDDDEEESSWAWCQGFSSGDQYYDHKLNEFRARAVRRLPI